MSGPFGNRSPSQKPESSILWVSEGVREGGSECVCVRHGESSRTYSRPWGISSLDSQREVADEVTGSASGPAHGLGVWGLGFRV